MDEEFTIVYDTRENMPLNFRRSKYVKNIKRKKLNTGDYSIEGMEHLISIERKSPTDLFNTLGKGIKRFKKEIERAVNLEYFAILVECRYMEVLNKTFENSHYSSLKGNQVIQTLNTLKLKYGIDVIFANDRVEAASIVRNLFISFVKQKRKPTKCVCNNNVMRRAVRAWRKKVK